MEVLLEFVVQGKQVYFVIWVHEHVIVMTTHPYYPYTYLLPHTRLSEWHERQIGRLCLREAGEGQKLGHAPRPVFDQRFERQAVVLWLPLLCGTSNTQKRRCSNIASTQGALSEHEIRRRLGQWLGATFDCRIALLLLVLGRL